MKKIIFHLALPLIVASAMPGLATAKNATERSLEVRAIERDGENHVKIYLSAFEIEADKKFPITTLDTNSFILTVDGEPIQKPQLSLTTFSASRKWNTRAIVWLYDASGVKSIKNLTRDLRTIAAQDFPQFQSDYLSIAGVASGKNFERVRLDPQNQENLTVLQRLLTAQNVALKSSAISNDAPVCMAARRFLEWQKLGLRAFDQKTLILMGGATPVSATEKAMVSECATTLRELGVIVHQVVFARPENYNGRLWLTQEQMGSTGSTHRVVDVTGASRALQTIRSSIDSEYIITSQVPADTFWRSKNLVLQAKYHGSIFQTETLKLPAAPLAQTIAKAQRTPADIRRNDPQTNVQAPQRMIILTGASALAFDAWLEWLATALLIGIIVTIRHMHRLNSGVLQLSETESQGETNSGPVLVVLNGRDKGREYRIRQHTTLLGKGWGCDIRLQPMKVKSKHGQLEIQGDKAILRDLSEGDLYVNGRAVRSLRVIGHGTVIKLGELQLLFQCGET